MILNRTPLTIAEVKSYAGETLSENKVLADYIKSFEKLSEEKAKSLVEDIKALKNPKIKEDLAVKVADFLPRDTEDVNKIFIENSLSEEEAQALLSVVKKY